MSCLSLFPFFLCGLLLKSAIMPVSAQTMVCDHTLPPRDFHWFEQPVEHKAVEEVGSPPTEQRPSSRWQQRFTEISEFYKPGGPLLFLVGPETPLLPSTLFCSVLPIWARELGAYVVAPEHRFFGESIPTQNSFASLTIENALEDYAAIIRYFRKRDVLEQRRRGGDHDANVIGENTLKTTSDDDEQVAAGAAEADAARVVVVGGSYGGFLAAMLRLKYPGIVEGAVASAAPIFLWDGGGMSNEALAPRWFDRLGQILKQKDPECSAQIQNTFKLLLRKLDSDENTDRAELAATLNLCQVPRQQSNYLDRFELLSYVQRAVQIVTQFNFPFKGAAKVGFAFQNVCTRFKQAASSPGELLEATNHLLDLGMNSTGTLRCFPFNGRGSPRTLSSQGGGNNKNSVEASLMLSGATDQWRKGEQVHLQGGAREGQHGVLSRALGGAATGGSSSLPSNGGGHRRHVVPRAGSELAFIPENIGNEVGCREGRVESVHPTRVQEVQVGAGVDEEDGGNKNSVEASLISPLVDRSTPRLVLAASSSSSERSTFPPNKNSAEPSTPLNFGESWYYLTCTEFIQPIAGGDEFFGGFEHDFHFVPFVSNCARRFPGTTVRPFSGTPAVTVLQAKTSNLIFSNQGFDPTAAFSLNVSSVTPIAGVSPPGDPVISLVSESAAHTADILYPQPTDKTDLVRAREAELQAIRRWVGSVGGGGDEERILGGGLGGGDAARGAGVVDAGKFLQKELTDQLVQ